MTDATLFSIDDIFILGNTCGAAVSAGKGAEVTAIFKCLQLERPQNAGGFIMEAIYWQHQGKISKAMLVLEEADTFTMERNGDEAMALYTLLMLENNQHDQAYKTARDLLAADTVISESARQTLRSVMKEVDNTEDEGEMA